MAASLDEITQQVINLNSVIKELQVGAAEAKRVIEAQHARINLLQQPGGAGGQGREQGDHHRFQRRVDLKVLAPEPFTSKDEHRWREWAEEFEDYIEGIDSNLAAFMRSAPDEETPIDDSNLELVESTVVVTSPVGRMQTQSGTTRGSHEKAMLWPTAQSTAFTTMNQKSKRVTHKWSNAGSRDESMLSQLKAPSAPKK